MSDKLTALSALSTPAAEDLIYIVDDPSGTPASKKVTLATLLAAPLFIDNLGTNWNRYALGAGMFRVIRTLDNDQIKALPTAEIELAPAPGAGFMINMFSGAWLMHIVAAYTNFHSAAAVNFVWGTDNAGWGVATYYKESEAVAFGNTGDHFVQFGAYMQGGNSAATPSLAFWNQEYTDLDNQKLSLRCSNNVIGDLTGGNAANTLKVIADYTILPI